MDSVLVAIDAEQINRHIDNMTNRNMIGIATSGSNGESPRSGRLTLKSALNETDPEMLAILKEKLSEIKSDDDGRNLMLKIQAAFQPGVAHYGRGRR